MGFKPRTKSKLDNPRSIIIVLLPCYLMNLNSKVDSNSRCNVLACVLNRRVNIHYKTAKMKMSMLEIFLLLDALQLLGT